jgi:YVTN family beta-propeller protein
VANTGSGDVSVIDGSTNAVAKPIPVGNGPTALEYNPSNGKIYVANRDSPSVSVIDSSTNAVIGTIGAGGSPWAEGFRLEYNQNNSEMFVTNALSDSVSVIDSSNNKVIDNISVGQGPLAIKYNPINNNIYVANIESGDVSIISTKPPIAEKPVADAGPNQAAQSDDQVQLDGGKSYDPNGSPLTFSWTQTRGPDVTLDNPASEKPEFTAPQATDDGKIVFRLTVTNDEGETSEPDLVTISVSPAPQPPNNPSPSNDIQKLIDTIDKMHLPNGVAKSLEDPLNMAMKQLNENNDESACKSLDAFLNQVETNESNGQLTSQQAEDLSQQATEIQQEIECPSLPLPTLTSSSSESKGPSSGNSDDTEEGMVEPTINPSDSEINPTETEISDKEVADKPKGEDSGDVGNSPGLYRDFFDTGRDDGH